MIDSLMMYIPIILAVIGAASALAAGLAPLVKSPEWRARLGFATTALDMVYRLLGKLALNPKAK